MKINKKYLQDLIIDETSIVNKNDLSHIDNYKKLVSFFENSIVESMKENKLDYDVLYKSHRDCIRMLRDLIRSYENQIIFVQGKNAILNNLVDLIDNKENESVIKKTEDLSD